MSGTRHERPGVYSVYDASGVTTAGRAPKVIGVAALAVKGTAGTVVTLTRYSAGVEAFGEDAAAAPGMSTLLKLLFQNGASTVEAVRVDEAGDTAAYQAAFAALADREVQVMVCDSSDLAVQKALKAAVEAASGARKERIGVIGGSGDTAAELVTRAAAINSERMVLVGPDLVRGGHEGRKRHGAARRFCGGRRGGSHRRRDGPGAAVKRRGAVRYRRFAGGLRR